MIDMTPEMEEVTYRTISTSHPMFQNRNTKIYSMESKGSMKLQSQTPIPDEVVLCDGCNSNLHPGDCDAVYIDGELYDVYCQQCRKSYFPQAVSF